MAILQFNFFVLTVKYLCNGRCRITITHFLVLVLARLRFVFAMQLQFFVFISDALQPKFTQHSNKFTQNSNWNFQWCHRISNLANARVNSPPTLQNARFQNFHENLWMHGFLWLSKNILQTAASFLIFSVNVCPCSLLPHTHASCTNVNELPSAVNIQQKSQDCLVMLNLVKKQSTRHIWNSWFSCESIPKPICALWANIAPVIFCSCCHVVFGKHWLDCGLMGENIVCIVQVIVFCSVSSSRPRQHCIGYFPAKICLSSVCAQGQ